MKNINGIIIKDSYVMNLGSEKIFRCIIPNKNTGYYRSIMHLKKYGYAPANLIEEQLVIDNPTRFRTIINDPIFNWFILFSESKQLELYKKYTGADINNGMWYNEIVNIYTSECENPTTNINNEIKEDIINFACIVYNEFFNNRTKSFRETAEELYNNHFNI